MTEAESLFRQTEKERKRLGYGAKHKKRGGGRYVRLPSDSLTKKEREALNGEVKTYREKAFYTWQEFKELPDDLQVAWVNSLINRYGVGLETISAVVFGTAIKTLRNYFTRKDEIKYINRALYGKAGAAAKKKFVAVVHEWKNTQVTMCEDDLPEETRQDYEPEAEISPPETEIVEPVAEEKPAVNNLENIGALIQALRGTGARLTIEVTL